MTSRAFRVVEMFEEAMAEFTGARHGVAVESCSMALYLSCAYVGVGTVTIPARTYVSVPAAVIHAGGRVDFRDVPWTGAYRLEPYAITDSALRMRRGMYEGGLHCVSFHARKLLPIGRGGMVLTDDGAAADWLRRARFDGRTGSVPFLVDPVEMLGWNAYMTPEQAARGLQLLEALGDGRPDLTPDYPDLRALPVFAEVAV
jgi:dTDP-4-amino-4,6-dideoxygalactose transaminase